MLRIIWCNLLSVDIPDFTRYCLTSELFRNYHFLIFIIYDNDISYLILIIILMNNDKFSIIIKFLPKSTVVIIII